MDGEEAVSMSEARQMAEEGRRKQLKVLRDFEAGKVRRRLKGEMHC